MRTREEASREEGLAHSSSTEILVVPVGRVLVLYPGERIAFPLEVNGPPGHGVSVYAKGFPRSIASITITPESSIAPFTPKMEIRVNEGAAPGLYYFDLQAIDQTRGRILEVEPLGLLILPRNLPKSIVRHYGELRRITRELGIQGLLWYIVTSVYPEGTTFSQIHALHRLVTQRRISPGTTGNILRYMVKKKILVRENGVYKPLVRDIETLRSRIDTSRIRLEQRQRGASTKQKSRGKVPIQVYWAFDRARRIGRKHGPLAAMYFLGYTLVGVRQTGFLLLWIKGWFIYCENKTGFCHHLTSQLLSRYFRMLGLQEGIMYANTESHEEARRKAQKYIKEYYRSFRAARRLHYMLKDWDLIDRDEDQDVYMLELPYYQDGSIRVRIWDEQEKRISRRTKSK